MTMETQKQCFQAQLSKKMKKIELKELNNRTERE